MILDKGICTIFRKKDIALSGEMPRPVFVVIGKSWFGEDSFETSPARPTEGRKELRTDAKIRILQDRSIRQNDVVLLREVNDWSERTTDDAVYKIQRAWHGQDDDGPTPITDLSLEVVQP